MDKVQCSERLEVWEDGLHHRRTLHYYRCILTEGHGKPPMNVRAHLTKVDGQLVRWGCGIQDGMKT